MITIAYQSESHENSKPHMCKHLTIETGESFCTEITSSGLEVSNISDEVISEHIDSLFSYLKTSVLPFLDVAEMSTTWQTPLAVNGWSNASEIVQELSKWWVVLAERRIQNTYPDVESSLNTQ